MLRCVTACRRRHRAIPAGILLASRLRTQIPPLASTVLNHAGSRSASTQAPSPAAAVEQTTSASVAKKPAPGEARILCGGCGVGLQSRDQAAAGYIPSLKQLQELEANAAAAVARRLASGADDHDAHTFSGHGVICQRCFNTKHYNKLVPVSIPAPIYAQYVDTLRGLQPGKAVLLQVVDIFDFHGSLIADLDALLTENAASGSHGAGAAPAVTIAAESAPTIEVGGGEAAALSAAAATGGSGTAAAAAGASALPPPPPKPLILVVNKIDLLPTGTPPARVEAWVRHQLKATGLLREKGAIAQAASAAAAGGSAAPPDATAAAAAGSGVAVADAASTTAAGGGMVARKDRLHALHATTNAPASAVSVAAAAAAPAYYLHSVHLISARKQFGVRDLWADVESAKKEAREDVRQWKKATAAALARRVSGSAAASPAEDAGDDAEDSGNRYTDVYVLGAPNVGKSSLINALLGHVWNVPVASTDAAGGAAAASLTWKNDGSPAANKLSSLVLEPHEVGIVEKAVAERRAAVEAHGGDDAADVDDTATETVTRWVNGRPQQTPAPPRTDVKGAGKAKLKSEAQWVLDAVLAARRTAADKHKTATVVESGGVGATAASAAAAGTGASVVAASMSGRAGAPGIDAATNALLDATMADWKGRKDKYRRIREGAAVGMDAGSVLAAHALPTGASRRDAKLQPAAGSIYGGMGQMAPATPGGTPTTIEGALSETAYEGTLALAAQAAAAAAASSSQATAAGAKPTSATPAGPPPIPFTASPLPGTTLGVVGASLDPHGHSRIYDTPGLVVDPHKQRLLEALAHMAQAQRTALDLVKRSQKGDKHALAKLAAREARSKTIGNASANVTDIPRWALAAAKTSIAAAGDALHTMSLVVPNKRLRYETVRLEPGRTLFLGGLIRVDYLHDEQRTKREKGADTPGLLLTLACELPVHLTSTAKADEVWWRHVGPRMGVPAPPREDRRAGRAIAAAAGDGVITATADEPTSSAVTPAADPAATTTGDEESDLGLLTPWYAPLSYSASVRLADLCSRPMGGQHGTIKRSSKLAAPFHTESSAFSAATAAAASGVASPSVIAARAAAAAAATRAGSGPVYGAAAAAIAGVRPVAAWHARSAVADSSSPAVTSGRSATGTAGMTAAEQQLFADGAAIELTMGSDDYASADADASSAGDASAAALLAAPAEPSSFLSEADAALEDADGGDVAVVPAGKRDAFALRPSTLPLVSSSPQATLRRRREKERRALADIVFGGLGWVSVTPVAIEGMFGWERTVSGARLVVHVCEGVHVHVRPPLLPYEASGTGPKDWLS